MNQIREDVIHQCRHAYLIGIGGVGMSALARVLKHQHLEVSGSDIRESARTRELKQAGIPVAIGQSQVAFGDADLVIYSSAIRNEHLELLAARASGLKVYHRAEILSSLLNRAKTSVAVAGTHGKTTTASMISFVLTELGKNPTCLVGGDVLNLGTNTVLGSDDLWVSEVDESDQSHELYTPNYSVITNLEPDHLDHYEDMQAIRKSFEVFISNGRDPGLVVYFNEDVGLREIVSLSHCPAISYGFSEEADFSAGNICYMPFGLEFDLFEESFFVTKVRLSVPGRHNIANALACIAVTVQLGCEPEEVARILTRFRGAGRRLEVKHESSEMIVIDDYAHHPTEVKASISALKKSGKPLTVIFQPHRYSRTRYFLREFANAFDGADQLILTDIYSAGESNVHQIDISSLYHEIKNDIPVRILRKQEIIPALCAEHNLNGIIAFLGAGDIGDIADEFANRLKGAHPVAG
ncbi:MAG: UDP-N-acetylmuramate--L-alanine ligase [Candidatus Omnitrophica bacterium]|nr:UDP-N-acetylmuramate--L-alanine ligase [Candidatus Omnitrophota bacterium]